MLYQLVLLTALLMGAQCDLWDPSFRHRETWLNGVEKARDQDEGTVYADESDILTVEGNEKNFETGPYDEKRSVGIQEWLRATMMLIINRGNKKKRRGMAATWPLPQRTWPLPTENLDASGETQMDTYSSLYIERLKDLARLHRRCRAM